VHQLVKNFDKGDLNCL